MNVTHQFQKIGIFLAENRPESILEQMTASVMTSVECDGIPRQQSLHHSGKVDGGSDEQKMEVVWHECPRETPGIGFGKDGAEPIEEQIPVRVI